VITLAGAVLVAAYDWNLLLVYSLLVAGSLSGSMVAYIVGRTWRGRRKDLGRVGGLVARFERRAWLYLLGHRFVPGMRALFLIAAGLANASPARVALLSAISACIWFALVLTAGMAIGENLDELQTLLHQYSLVVWSILGTALVVWLVWKLRRQRRS
jgi:membrane protein DedA with SNARE-associated domain